MGIPTYRAKRDNTEKEIIKALRDFGCLVMQTKDVDLTVQYRGQTYLIECKTPQSKAGRINKTESQKKLVEAGWRIYFIKSADEAIEFVQSLTRRAA